MFQLDIPHSLTDDPTTWNVLVVDDDPFNLELVRDVLSFFEIRCESAESGKIALIKFVDFKPNVVLLDLSMPELSGWNVIDAIRLLTTPSMPSTVVIALTAHAMESDRQRCLEAGFNGFMTKPIEIDQLVGQMSKIIQGVLQETVNG